MALRIAGYILSFVVIWLGAGMIVGSVDKLSKKLNISAFAISFFVLGILTSLPEFALGINALIDKNPELFVGNLIGGQIVLFLLVIPILAIIANGIKMVDQLKGKNILFSFVIITLPAIVVLDRQVNAMEGFLLILFYAILFFLFKKEKNFFEKVRDRIFYRQPQHLTAYGISILIGIALVFISSKFIVDTSLYFSQLLGISSYILGLLILSLGTNLPELSLAIRSVHLGRKDIALGDYIGSASANTLIFGILTLINGKTFSLENHFFLTLFFLISGMVLFWFFSRTKHSLSRWEGIILIIAYIVFFILESAVS